CSRPYSRRKADGLRARSVAAAPKQSEHKGGLNMQRTDRGDEPGGSPSAERRQRLFPPRRRSPAQAGFGPAQENRKNPRQHGEPECIPLHIPGSKERAASAGKAWLAPGEQVRAPGLSDVRIRIFLCEPGAAPALRE